MSTATVQAIPEGMHSLTPHLVCAGAFEAITFYQKAFGAKELSRLIGPDQQLLHGRLQIGNSQLMLVEENPAYGSLGPLTLKGSPVSIHLQVENADAVFAQAISAGATPLMPVAEMFWGDRFGVLKDPFGHCWTVGTHVRDLSPEEIHAGTLKACQEAK